MEGEPPTTDEDMVSPSPSPRPGSMHSRSHSGSVLAKEQKRPLSLIHRSSSGTMASIPLTRPLSFRRGTSSSALESAPTASMPVLPQSQVPLGEYQSFDAKGHLKTSSDTGDEIATAIRPDSSSTPYPSLKRNQQRIPSPSIETIPTRAVRGNSVAGREEREVDMDATPRPRKPPPPASESVLVPRTSIFDQQPRVSKSAPIPKPALRLAESGTVPRMFPPREEDDAPMRHSNGLTGEERSRRVREMEERLQKLMGDIQSAERRLVQVKSNLD